MRSTRPLATSFLALVLLNTLACSGNFIPDSGRIDGDASIVEEQALTAAPQAKDGLDAGVDAGK